VSFMAIQRATIEWAVANKDKVLKAVIDAAPEGKTRQLEMFGSADSGRTLKGSMKAKATGRLGSTSITITAGVSYALIIRDGHGIIVPKKAKVLHWVDETGQDVFTMRVGPTQPNPYPQRGWDKVREEVRGDLTRRMTEAALSELLSTAKLGGFITRL
jgi:hypothetical protein